MAQLDQNPRVNGDGQTEIVPDVTEDSNSDNTSRPPGDWSVAPDPVEPNKPGQQIEDPRETGNEDLETDVTPEGP